MSSQDEIDDFDDIFMSDDEDNTKRNSKFESKIDKDPIVPIPTISKENEKPKPVLKRNDDLFGDSDIPLDLNTKRNVTAKNPGRPAKSVLDDLLKPSSDLLSFDRPKSSFNPTISKSEASNSKIDKNMDDEHDDFWNMQRPKTMELGPTLRNKPDLSATAPEPTKRSVRFSTENVLENNFDDEIENSFLNPQSTIPDNKPQKKFKSRFEEEDDDPAPFNSLFNTVDEHEVILRNNPTSKTEFGFDTSPNDEFGRKQFDPKKRLSEFMDDDRLYASHNSVKLTQLKDSDDNRQDQLDSRDLFGNSSSIKESPRRRSVDNILDSSPRPKTAGVSRTIEFSDDLLNDFERPKSGHGYSQNRHKKFNEEPTRIIDSNSTNTKEYDVKIRHLESERDDLLYKISAMEKRTKEEKDLLESNYKNKIELLEENSNGKIKRLQEEVEILTDQNNQKLQLLEKERIEMRNELRNKQDDIEDQHKNDLKRINEQHKFELDKQEHQYSMLIQNLEKAKQQEQETLKLAQPTTVRLQEILQRVMEGTDDLSSLRREIGVEIGERERDIDRKGDELRKLEKKLEKEREENVEERERLQNLISKLDLQLKEQSKTYEDEKWYLKQEQNKLSVLQKSLEAEREAILTQKDTNRKHQEQFQQQMLDEQKLMLEKLYEEKRLLSEERVNLTREISRWSESSQYSDVKKNQERAEVEGLKSALLEERKDIEKQKEFVFREKEDIQKLKNQMVLQKHEFELQESRLSQQNRELTSQAAHQSEKEQYYKRIEEESQEAWKKARHIQQDQQRQLGEIREQLLQLDVKEKRVVAQREELERLKADLEKSSGGAGVCKRCGGNFKMGDYLKNGRDSALGASITFDGNYSKNFGSHTQLRPGYTRDNSTANYTVNDDILEAFKYSNYLASQTEEHRLIKSIKDDAEQDHDFLMQEAAFLNSLQFNPSKSHVKS